MKWKVFKVKSPKAEIKHITSPKMDTQSLIHSCNAFRRRRLWALRQLNLKTKHNMSLHRRDDVFMCRISICQKTSRHQEMVAQREKTAVFLFFSQKCPPTEADILSLYPQSLWYFTSQNKKGGPYLRRMMSKCSRSSLYLLFCQWVLHAMLPFYLLSTRWCTRRR